MMKLDYYSFLSQTRKCFLKSDKNDKIFSKHEINVANTILLIFTPWKHLIWWNKELPFITLQIMVSNSFDTCRRGNNFFDVGFPTERFLNFRWKTEGRERGKEEIDGRRVIPRKKSALLSLMWYCFFPICTGMRRVNNFVSRRRKV